MTSQRRSLPPAQPGTSNLEQLKVQHATLLREFKKYKGRMKAWWRGLGREERLEFLLGWCPYMPLAPGKAYCMVDGKRMEVYGAAMAVPEFNQEELVIGDKLLEVLSRIAEPPADPQDTANNSSGEEQPAPVLPFMLLCYQEMPFAHTLVGRIKSSLAPDLQRGMGMVDFTTGPNFGTHYKINQMMPNIQQLFDMGAMVPPLAFEALIYRINLLLSSAAMCVDEFRMEVLGKDYKVVGPSLGCAGCGAAQGEGGRKLAACSECGITFYCGKECQRTHWKVGHKSECRAWTQSKGERAAGAAAAAAADGGGPTRGASTGSGAARSSSSAADAAAENMAHLQVQ